MPAGIEGVGGVVSRLSALSLRSVRIATVNVGYNADYAVYVHENLEARHIVGQAKYLERPSRELRTQLRAIIITSLLAPAQPWGWDVGLALKKAGDYLLDQSKKIVPVQSGTLRDSGFSIVTRQGVSLK
jgi:hypothetical protein